MSPIYLFTLSLLGLAGCLAFVRGGVWERATWIVLVAAWIVSAILPFDYRSPSWGAIAADIFVFMFLLYGAMRTRYLWLPVAAGFQFLILATHYVFATNTELRQWAYISAYYVWNIGLIATLCVASLSKAREGPL
jgi:hypothetical protein